MEVIHPMCAGLDVHQKTVVACRLYTDNKGKLVQETKTFSTMTKSLHQLTDWLVEAGITHLVMESTGDYWKSVYNILGSNFEIWLVNAHHFRNVPGRKTDVKDAQWLAELMRHGLLRRSFVPDEPQRDLRDLTRMRLVLVRERASVTNRLHKALETANIKLGAVASDVSGSSCRKMLRQLLDNPEARPEEVADLALGSLRSKREDLALALEGRMTEHSRFMIDQLLDQLTQLDARIRTFESRIEEQMLPFKVAVARIDGIPSISLTIAHALISEIGTDMSRFASAAHLASWLGLCPGNNQSGGKRLSGRIRHGNTYARINLVQAAHAACKMKDTQFYTLFCRIAARRGKKRAVIAVAHALVVTIYHLLSKQVDYQEPGPDYLIKRNPERELERLRERAARLGHAIVPQAQAA